MVPPKELRKSIHQLGNEYAMLQLQMNMINMQNQEYQTLNEKANEKITQLATKIELMEFEKAELKNAFEKIQRGKEKELQDAHLVYFAKKQEIVERFNDLKKKFEQYKVEVNIELDIKDKITETWKKKYDKLH
jgi:hypothetical protein